MTNTAPDTTNNRADHVEKLLDAANSASQTVAALHVGFLAFVAYLGVIVWGTSHEDLLRISPVKLPILDVELPLTAFYNFVPWMVVLLHFNLLMQLELLSCKLWNLDSCLPDNENGQQVRDRLFIFPFTHLIVGRSGVLLIRWLLSLVVGITVIALPLFMLLAAQIRFLPFHDEAITWSQRFAIWVDAAMLLALWPLTASPQDKALEWWRNAGFRLLGHWPQWFCYLCKRAWYQFSMYFRRLSAHSDQLPKQPESPVGAEPKGMIVLLVSVPLVILLSIVAVIPGSMTVQAYYNPPPENVQPMATSSDAPSYFEDWLIRKAPTSWLSVAAYVNGVVTCKTLPQAEKSDASILQVMLGPCTWFNWGLFPRNLDLKEARLVPKEVTLSQLTRAIDPNKKTRDNAFKEFDGLNLQNRDLRFANLQGAVLPKADIRHVQLQGAVLLQAKLQGAIGWDRTQLQGAILGGTQLQGAGLVVADLRNANLQGAALQGANLGWATLQSADLRGANLQGAILQKADLSAADLRGANLQGANLRTANLQGASLDYAQLQGADMVEANLQGAVLLDAALQGSDWAKSTLDGAFIGAENPLPTWDDQARKQLEASLKPILDAEKFGALQARVQNSAITPTDGPLSQVDCYSTIPKLLACDFHELEQLDNYRRQVLYPKTMALACSEEVFAIGIARRASEEIPEDKLASQTAHPHFYLANALLAALKSGLSCAALSALPEQAREKLAKTAQLHNKIGGRAE